MLDVKKNLQKEGGGRGKHTFFPQCSFLLLSFLKMHRKKQNTTCVLNTKAPQLPSLELR